MTARAGDYETAGSHPLGYTAEDEEQALKSYWEVPANVIENQDKLHAWAERAYQVALKSGTRRPAIAISASPRNSGI